MSDPFKHNPIPPAALWALLGLVVFSLVAVVVAQALGYKAGQVPTSNVVEQRDLLEIAGQDRVGDASAGPGREPGEEQTSHEGFDPAAMQHRKDRGRGERSGDGPGQTGAAAKETL